MTTLVSALIDIARRIGRWVIERLARVAGRRLGFYMLERAEVFRARAKRAKSARRKRWHTGRAKRWEKAGAWLLAWSDDVGKCIATEADTLLAKAKGLPRVAKCERMVAA